MMEKSIDLGHWLLADSIDAGELKKKQAFCYRVIFSDGRFYIGYKLIYSVKSGKETGWRSYRTSSKLVKSLIKGGDIPVFTIVSLHDTQESALLAERDLLISCDAKNNDMCLNQCVHGDWLRRLPESYNDENVKRARDGLIAYVNSDAYVHPMQGKVHPNKGKSLPQTAPKEHVSVKNIQITDGVSNKWWPKGQEIPEGFSRGVTRVRGRTGGDTKLATAGLVKKARERYAKNVKHCSICGNPLSYERKTSQYCSEDCSKEGFRRKTAKRKGISTRSVESLKTGRDSYAQARGYETYEMLAKACFDLLKENTYNDVAAMLNMVKSTVYSLKKYWEKELASVNATGDNL